MCGSSAQMWRFHRHGCCVAVARRHDPQALHLFLDILTALLREPRRQKSATRHARFSSQFSNVQTIFQASRAWKQHREFICTNERMAAIMVLSFGSCYYCRTFDAHASATAACKDLSENQHLMSFRVEFSGTAVLHRATYLLWFGARRVDKKAHWQNCVLEYTIDSLSHFAVASREFQTVQASLKSASAFGTVLWRIAGIPLCYVTNSALCATVSRKCNARE